MRVKKLIAVVGDANLNSLGADDFLDFRNWWWEKITSQTLIPSSANRDFTHIGSTFRLVCRAKRLLVPQGLGGLNFSEGEKRTRVPFSESWIRDKLLAPGALSGLNTEARCVLLGMVSDIREEARDWIEQRRRESYQGLDREDASRIREIWRSART